MTQEELDALMSGDIEDLDSSSDDDTDTQSDEELGETAQEDSSDDKPLGYNDETSHHWPLPATEEHKMVHQLDDVTKESEEKATEIFDIIEGISTELMEKEENVNSVVEVLNSNIELFTTLAAKFPDVEAFATQLDKNSSALDEANCTLEMIQTSGDSIMSVMDIMQYQDIHRQKIERVINVMRALSTYMNSLFEGKIDDDKRASSAQHLPGDENADIASTDDIEALLAQFGNND
ncbi:MAG: chemotaxis protein [Sulfurimonas sp.]|nr:chemotaxis protein [Sulfurimonas sp.]